MQARIGNFRGQGIDWSGAINEDNCHDGIGGIRRPLNTITAAIGLNDFTCARVS